MLFGWLGKTAGTGLFHSIIPGMRCSASLIANQGLSKNNSVGFQRAGTTVGRIFQGPRALFVPVIPRKNQGNLET